MKYLKELCLLNGISGDESDVRNYITEKISDKCTLTVDALGNLIAFRKGRKTPDKKLIIAAHMDEVGFIVTAITPDGTVLFDTVGGIDSSVISGKRVCIGKNKIKGVIGSLPVHRLSAEKRKKFPELSSMYIDIGADSREQAEKYINIGDCVYFDSEYIEFGNSFIKSKAIDDRAGCSIMIELIEKEHEFDTWYCFNVQEEIGLRGSRTSAFRINPDYAIVLESTTASDIDGVSGAKRVCELGKGAVVSYMDRATMYDRNLYRLAFDTAKENNIKIQTKTVVAGGNDSGAIHLSGSGVKTMAISLPCRYLHSPSCVIKSDDYSEAFKLADILRNRILADDKTY
mgnify:FL=1